MHEEGTIPTNNNNNRIKKGYENHVCNLCNFLREICESVEKVFRHHFLKDEDCRLYLYFFILTF